MSQTYIAMYVLLLSQVLPHIGVQIGSPELTTFVSTALSIVAALWALIRRYQAGDVAFFGRRKA